MGRIKVGKGLMCTVSSCRWPGMHRCQTTGNDNQDLLVHHVPKSFFHLVSARGETDCIFLIVKIFRSTVSPIVVLEYSFCTVLTPLTCRFCLMESLHAPPLTRTKESIVLCYYDYFCPITNATVL